MARNVSSSSDHYRVLSPGRVGLAPMIGLAALVLSVAPLVRWIEDLTPVPRSAVAAAALPLPPSRTAPDALVVHIQDSGFFIEGADDELAPGDRRIWCESDRCDEQDMRLLTARLAQVKAARPGTDHVVFMAGRTVPFGRVQAAMDAARQDSWDALPGDTPTWLFPRVTVQPGAMGEDRFLRWNGPAHARL